MIKILLIEKDNRVISLISEYLRKELSADIFNFHLKPDIEKILDSEQFDIIIVRNIIEEVPIAIETLNILYDRGIELPTVILGEVQYAGKKFDTLPDRFKLDELRRKIIKVCEITKSQLEELKLPEYIPISISNFYLMTRVECDVFIRIKKKEQSDQFIKRLHAGDSFDKETIVRYESRGAKDLYIKKEDRDYFFKALNQQTLEALTRANISEEEQVELSNESFEISRDLLFKFGVKEHTVEMAEGSIKVLSENILNTKGFNEIKQHINSILKSKSSFSYKRSYLVSIFSAEIMPRLDWGGSLISAIEKLIFVSFFHDMYLESTDQCKIRNKQELHRSTIEKKQKDTVMNHANMASTLVQKFPKTPPDVDIIIRQHHGTSNGIGFSDRPNSSLSSLSIIFIVVEFFVDEILNFENGVSTMEGIFTKMEEYFAIPSYRKAVHALKEIVIGVS